MWPEIWSSTSNNSQHKETQHWAKEKPKLDKPDECEELFILFRKTWNLKFLWRTREENWNRMWNQLCHASRKEAQEIQP